MKRNIIKAGMGVMAFALALGLSGCGRSKQNAALALDEARLNISAAKSIATQLYAAETLKAAEAALKKADSAFQALHYDIARTEAEKSIQLAKQSQIEAEAKVAEKKLKSAKKGVTTKKAVKPAKKKK